MKWRVLKAVLLLFVLFACGSSSTVEHPDVPMGLNPIVFSVDPTSGAAGSTVTINGVGFSDAPPVNVVTIGTAATEAAAYNIIEEPTSSAVEVLTVVVPDTAVAGENPVVVIVHGTASNADVTFTVTE